MSIYEPRPIDEEWHLLRKVFLLFLVVTATALGLVVLLTRQKGHVPPVLFNMLADVSLGLLAGLAARLALRDRHSAIQWLASAAASLVGLGVLGYLTNWRSGIGPFQAGLVTLESFHSAHISLRLPLQFGQSGMNMLDLVHAVIAMDTSWIALRVWKQGPRVNGNSLSPRVQRPARWRPAQANASVIVPVPATPAERMPAPASLSPRARIRRKRSERSLIAQSTPAIRPVRSRPRRSNTRHRRPAVHLAVYEEHRCPYCLEPVSRNDPRGTVECQICHTLHHRDCWDITGNCQVPHLTT